MHISYSLINPILRVSQIFFVLLRLSLATVFPSSKLKLLLTFSNQNIACISYFLMHLTCPSLIHLLIATVLGEDEVPCDK
jgi:hypothetical protein